MNVIRKYSQIICKVLFFLEILLFISLFITPDFWANKATYNRFVSMQLLPAMGCTSLFLSIFHIRVIYIIMGAISSFSFFISMFIGYLLLGH